MSKRRFCDACGEALPLDARFCRSCGAPVAEAQSPPPTGKAPAKGEVSRASPSQPGKALLVGAGVVALIVAMAAVGLASRDGAGTGSPSPSPPQTAPGGDPGPPSDEGVLGPHENATTGSDETEIVTLRPVDDHSNPVPGYTVTESLTASECSAASSAIGNAYRCFAESHSIYDPCWSSSEDVTTVLCLTEPWSTDLTRLTVTSYLEPTIGTDDIDFGGDPWGIELLTGERCLLAQGARDDFNGQIVAYYCDDDLVLLDRADRSQPVWNFHSASFRGSSYIAGPTVSVRTAWYGIPNPA